MTIANIELSRLVPGAAERWVRQNLASGRSRFLVALFLFLAGLAGLSLIEPNDAAIVQMIALQQRELVRLEQLAGSDVWHRRRTESDMARVHAEGRLWEAETDGIAQANFQSWIMEEAKRAGIGPVDIRLAINASANNPLKLRQLSAQIHGRFDAAALFRFTRAIAAHERLLVVNRLEIHTAPAPYFEMLLDTYLRPARTA